MATIITREVGTTAKGSPLTNAEIDNNFINLNTQITYNGPSIAPSLNLDFANSKTVDPRITFSRESKAAYYDGKTTAKAEENLLTFSQSMHLGSWAASTSVLTGNATVAPDGTTTAIKIAGTVGLARHGTYQNVYVQNGSIYTLSVYAKAAEHTILYLANGAISTFRASFDLTAGTLISYEGSALLSTSITSVGNGWYRCSVTSTAASSLAPAFGSYPVGSTVDAYGPTFTGDGVSGIYIWGAQLEQRAFPTAYTPTTSSPITNYIPVLQTAANNAARIDHDPVTGECKGLLIEEQRANLLTYSSDFDNPAWTKFSSYVAASCVIAPDGTLSGDKLYEHNSANYHWLGQAKTVSASTTYTFSFYAKSAEKTSCWFEANMGANSVSGTYNLSAGSASGTGASMVSVGNGWYRCVLVFTTAAGVSSMECRLGMGSLTYYNGDGYSGIYIWGVQLEQGAFATSYIPTALTYSGRASTATYQGDDGFLATAAVNAPRYQRNAQGGKQLLLEGASSNLFSNTSRLTSNAWYKNGTVAMPSNLVAPDGTLTGTFLREDTGNYDHGFSSVNITYTGGTTYTASLYAKAGGRSEFAFAFGNTAFSGYPQAYFNVVSGTITGTYGVTASMTKINGWFRCSITATATSSGSDTIIIQYLNPGNTYAGDNSSGIHFYGVQLETGSIATSYMPSVDTFTGRNGPATYFDSTGVLRTAPANAPRYGYGYDTSRAKWVSQGLLVEASSANLLTYSEQFDNWSVFESTVSGNATASPDGSATADKVVESTAYSYHLVSRGFSSSIGSTNTVSFYAKAGGRSFVYSRVSGALIPDAGASFNLSAGTVNNLGGAVSAGIQPVGNGWFRCFYTLPTLTASSGTLYFFPAADGVTAGNQNPYYTGDGTSGIYIWGAQVETGSVATSYIPTTNQQVTRAADSATSVGGTRAADVYSSSQATRLADAAKMEGTNFSSWYRQDEGTFYQDFTALGVSATDRVSVRISPGGGFFANDITLRNYNGSNVAGVFVNSTLQCAISINPLVSAGSINRAVMAYKTDDFAASKNGSNVGVDTSALLPSGMNTLEFPSSGCNHIKKFAYYPKRLSNTELQALTVN